MEVERVHILSRSPGAVLVEILVSDEAGYSFVDVVSDDTGVGRSAPLHPPPGDGVREGATLSRSPGAVLVEILVSDETGYSFVDVVSDRAGVGRSAPLHPLG